jgi:cardiolipin synthase
MPLTLANKITILRIILVPFFVAVILYYKPERDYYRLIALGLFVLASLLDVVDGYIARRTKQMTKAGAMLDPVADKLLLISAFVTLYVVGLQFDRLHFPLWLVVGVISRDAILLVGALVVHIAQGELIIKPNLLGKLTTAAQVFCVIGILLQFEYSSVLWSVTLILTICSGLFYLRQGIEMLNKGV